MVLYSGQGHGQAAVEGSPLEQIFSQLIHQARATWRRRWWSIPVAAVICLLGWSYITTLPDRYQSSSRVFVNTDSVLEPLLGGMTVRPNTEQQVRIMTRTLLSDSNLEQIARAADLDVLAGHDDPRALVDMLRGIDLRQEGRDNIYTISFAHRDPEVAYRVVREAGNLFMEHGLGQADLLASQDFIQRQISRYEQLLTEQERALQRFRREHSAHFSGGGDVHQRLERTREALAETTLRRDELAERVQALRAHLEGDELPEAVRDRYSHPELDERIHRLENDLDNLRRRFTDEHPDVRQTRRILADLRSQREQEFEARLAEGAGVSSGHPLRMALTEAESELTALDNRVTEQRERIARLEELAEEDPEIQSEHRGLERNYQVLRESYNQLLNRRERAALSGIIQRETDAVDFRVLEPPRRPEAPSEPNRPALASAALLLGLGGGAGFAFLLAQVRGSVMSATQLGELTGRPVLGQITRVRTPEHRRRRRRELLAFVTAVGVLVAAFGGVLWHFG